MIYKWNINLSPRLDEISIRHISYANTLKNKHAKPFTIVQPHFCACDRILFWDYKLRQKQSGLGKQKYYLMEFCQHGVHSKGSCITIISALWRNKKFSTIKTNNLNKFQYFYHHTSYINGSCQSSSNYIFFFALQEQFYS